MSSHLFVTPGHGHASLSNLASSDSPNAISLPAQPTPVGSITDMFHAKMIPGLSGQTRVVYQWLRLDQLDQWWHWVLLLAVTLAVMTFVIFWYRRDSSEHPKPVGWALLLLRIAALAGILLYFFQLDKRTEQRVVRDSRVAILVDSSLSMSLPGTPSEVGVPSSISRAEEATRFLQQSPLLEQLRERHQVSVYRFDSSNRPVALAAFNKSADAETLDVPASQTEAASLERGRSIMLAAGVLGTLAALFILISLAAQIGGARDWQPGGWLLFAGSSLALFGLIVSSFAVVPTTRYPLAALFGADLPPLPANTANSEANSAEPGQEASQDPSLASNGSISQSDLADAFTPAGVETRLGDAIKSILDRETGNPLAGLVVLTDGRSNAGLAPRATVPTAQNSRVPLYVVGLGSDQSPPNVQLVELDVPRRLYPGDRFSLLALIGSTGFSGKTVTVQISAGPIDAEESALSIEAEKQIVIPADGSLATATFELDPKAVGTWQYSAKVIALAGDADPRDNAQVARVEVIERKNRVLLFAGGPTREYQFVRNLLYRDQDVESHVLLQSGGPLTSQESQELLEEFPASRAELSEYDAIISFDADWTQVSDSSVQALEQWVAEQAGGFILVAGSVEMPKWMARSASGIRSTLLRSLSPVVLDQRGSSLLAAGRVESETPWALKLTAEGQQTDFLWVNDDPALSLDAWAQFEGVHTFYSAYELKPGGRALALFSDPTAAVDGQLPIYIASQFYGSGRVVFQGGGELWRIRAIDEGYFDRYYTKLVRWVSQGRLLLDSDRGILLVDREEALLGEQVTVRAVLKNERYEPLVQSEVVTRLIDPQDRNLPLVLRPLSDGSQPGVYTGQFPVLVSGEYRIQYQLGGLASDEVLSADVLAKVPAVEMQNAERNDKLLFQMAAETGGKYYRGTELAATPTSSGTLDVVDSIAPQDQVAYLPGATDRVFQIRWLGWLMALIAGSLSLEWLSRRLHRLA